MGSVVITGANRGIGLELCKLYLGQGRNVYAVCRESSSELSGLIKAGEQVGLTIIDGVDVADDTVIPRLQRALKGQAVDLLINNAGIFASDNLGEINFLDVQQQILVNAIAPLKIAQALLLQMQPGAKIAMITSRMGSISDNSSGGYYGYRMSKAALNAAGVSLARDLHPRGIAVALLHPGFVKTKMVGYAGDISPEVAARGLAARIEALTLVSSGSFWHSNGEVLPW